MTLSQVLWVFILLSQLSIPATAQTVEAIIGKNDLVLVNDDLSNVPNRYKKILPAIGRLSTPCTATHIGQGFVITAGHCFWQTFFDGALYENQTCTSGDSIAWQETAGNKEPKISQCLEIVAMQRNEDLNLDFAIMKVSEPPNEYAEIDWSDEAVKANSWLTIFSYPGENPLSWSKYCRVKKLTEHDVKPDLLHHTCDTTRGSSGAPVFNAVTGKIIGLHISSDGEPNADGSDTTTATENYSVYISKSPIKSLLTKAGYKFNSSAK